ncbi:MAG: PD40 domain-containing protein, partial [Gemmatimonadetes bacterium]|nr:PD40 domain-containing protein [Gemmatimonadota bacterium]
CVLYEMLAGSPPYVGPSAQAIIARKALEPVPSLRVVRDTVPVGVERALMRALAKVPADRFATARQFAEALSGAGDTLGPPSRVLPFARSRLVAVASVIVVIAAAGYIVLALRGGGGGERGLVAANFTRLTVDPGVEWFPSLSPDGQWLTYSGEASGNRDIYLLSVGGRNPINLTADSPEADDQPAFSPDGEQIAFRSEREGGGIFVMGRTGERAVGRRCADRRDAAVARGGRGAAQLVAPRPADRVLPAAGPRGPGPCVDRTGRRRGAGRGHQRQHAELEPGLVARRPVSLLRERSRRRHESVARPHG